MKITPKLLSIPPYVSVAWKDISSLHTKIDHADRLVLIISMNNLTQAEVPHLDNLAIEEIFDTFSRYHDQEKPVENKLLEGPFQFALPLKQGSPNDLMNASTSHNPQQANLPDLPPDMLEKITQIAKIFGLEDSTLLPKPEPHCNCLHCQVVRSLHGEHPMEKTNLIEEEISAGELTFRQWDIKQISEKLYTVTNLLDISEQYNVFLGEPLGCTCGQKNCEHLHAVLST